MRKLNATLPGQEWSSGNKTIRGMVGNEDLDGMEDGGLDGMEEGASIRTMDILRIRETTTKNALNSTERTEGRTRADLSHPGLSIRHGQHSAQGPW